MDMEKGNKLVLITNRFIKLEYRITTSKIKA